MPAHKIIFLTLIIALLLSACAPAMTGTPAIELPVPSATITRRFTPMPKPTKTLIPTLTLRASKTPSPTAITLIPAIPTFTPTFDYRTIVTATHSIPEQCPGIKLDLEPELGLPENFDERFTDDKPEIYYHGIADKILAFLNNGGDYHLLINFIKSYNAKYPNDRDVMSPTVMDITGDSIAEIIFEDIQTFPTTHIFSCHQGTFLDFVPVDPALDAWPIYITDILDLNANGIPELLYRHGSLGIFEWDGKGFREISFAPDSEKVIGTMMIGASNFSFRDTDSNGTIEIVISISYPGPLWAVLDEIPWRTYTIIYGWNGQWIDQVSKEFDSPQYRFQAIQDADTFTSNGQFDKAIHWYQETIFSDKLDWWSAERKEYANAYEFYSRDLLNNSLSPNETPPPEPEIDIAEYPRLAAYAYYRMVALHTYLGQMDAAQTKFATLQEKFPQGNPGYSYVEMATAFWNVYQSTQDITSACAAAIDYAAKHRDILVPLGSDYHGTQSRVYKPEDVCPFR